MQHNFKSFKIYILGVFCLLIFFLSMWLPTAEIVLTTFPEPLIADFRIKLNASVNDIFFNLETIPAEVVSLNQFNKQEDSRFINGLIDEDNRNIIIFKEDDLLKFVDYKIKDISKGSLTNKNIISINPDKWQVEVLKKDFINKNALISLKINEQVVRDYDYNSLRGKIVSKKINQAKIEIKKYLIVEDIVINVWPGFKKQMPMFENRMKIKVKHNIN